MKIFYGELVNLLCFSPDIAFSETVLSSVKVVLWSGQAVRVEDGFLGAIALKGSELEARSTLRNMNLGFDLTVIEKPEFTSGDLLKLLSQYQRSIGRLYVRALEASHSTQLENERLERSMLEMENYLNSVGVSNSSVVFNNSNPKLSNEVVVESGRIFQKGGSAKFEHVNRLTQLLPVQLSWISNIQLPGFWGQLENGARVWFELQRASNDEVVASWQLDDNSQRSDDGTVSLYLPSNLSQEDVLVKLVMTFSVSEGGAFYLQLAEQRFDKSTHVLIGEDGELEMPLQMKILKGIPFFRSIPFLGSIQPQGAGEQRNFCLSGEALGNASLRTHLDFEEFDLVAKRTGASSGLLVHPISSDIPTIAELELGHPVGFDGTIRVRATNEHADNTGVLISTFTSEKRLAEDEINNQAMNSLHWTYVGPNEQGLAISPVTKSDRFVYILTSIREGDKPSFCWLVTTDVAFSNDAFVDTEELADAEGVPA